MTETVTNESVVSKKPSLLQRSLVAMMAFAFAFMSFAIGVSASTTLAPEAPTNVIVTEGDGELSVTWDAPTQNSDGSAMSDLDGYNVYVDGTKDNASVITGTSYTVSGLTNDTSYNVEVTAVDTSGNESTKSTAVTGTPTATATSSNALDVSGVSLPFNATDLLNSSVGLMGVFGSFILLGLAVYFTPKLFGLLRSAARSGRN